MIKGKKKRPKNIIQLDCIALELEYRRTDAQCPDDAAETASELLETYMKGKAKKEKFTIISINYIHSEWNGHRDDDPEYYNYDILIIRRIYIITKE